jgi:hypothetical protein
MSKLQLSPNPSGAGIVTLAAPNTASDVTLTLPAVTAELITNSSGVLNIGSGQVYKDASGNVGIGTAAPTSGGKLDVNGIAYFGTADKLKIYSNNVLQTAGTFDVGTIGNASLNLITNNSTKVTINSSGNLLVGTTNSDPIGARVNATTFRSGTISTRSVNGNEFGIAGSSGAQITWYTDNGSTFIQAGSITSSGSTTAYNTSSDYRLKEITGAVTGAEAKDFIMALQPKQGTWKSDGSKFVGFLAHEFQAVSPSSVSGEKDAVDENGNPKYQGMQAASSEVMANLIALVQELTARLEVLENK